MLDQERYRQLMLIIHSGLFVGCFIFTFNVWSADQACYMVPCEDEHVFEQKIWKVDDWTVFSSVISGLWCSAVAGFGAALFYKPTLGNSPMLVGLYLGVTLVAAFAMLAQMGIWAAEWDTMGELSLVSHKDGIFHKSGTHLHLRTGLLAEFKWFTVLAAFCTCAQASIAALLVMGKTNVIDIFDLKVSDPNLSGFNKGGDFNAMKMGSGMEGASYQSGGGGGGTFAAY